MPQRRICAILPSISVAEGNANVGEYSYLMSTVGQFYGSFLVLIDDIGFSFLK